jgi:hypothetical protein
MDVVRVAAKSSNWWGDRVNVAHGAARPVSEALHLYLHLFDYLPL